MRIQIKATNTTLTPAIDEYVRKKVEAFGKFLSEEDDPQIHAEIGKTSAHHRSGDVFRAEFFAHIGGKDMMAVSEANDLFAAIDVAKDEFVKELRKNKTKKMTLLRRGGQKFKDIIRGFYPRK